MTVFSVLQHARETGLCFNLDKFKCARIPFIGHVIGADGLQPDPPKIESKLSMNPSTSLASLQTFLGMVQFLSRSFLHSSSPLEPHQEDK